MARNRCSLCDGKLNADHVCTLCGLDNTKSDRYYRLNQSNCDNAGLTHVHEDEHAKKAGRSILKQSSNMNGTGRTRTVNDCDFETDHKMTQKKYRQTGSKQTDPYTAKKRVDQGLNSDSYLQKKSMKKFIIILIIILIGSFADRISQWINIIRYSPDLIPYYIERSFDDIFGDDDNNNEYLAPDEYDIIENFDDYGPDDEYLDEFFDEFFGEFGDGSGAEFIEDYPEEQIEEGSL